MVQAADFGKRSGSEIGRVLVEREVCARPMVVGEIAG
jgi:hypothetical protein